MLLFMVVVPQFSGMARGQFAVDGVSDRGVYNDQVLLKVASQPGYTYRVTLDTNRIPTDVFTKVDAVDYHELNVVATSTSSGQESMETVHFIVQSSNRGNPEKGLVEWTPYPTINSAAGEFAGAQMHVVAPKAFPSGFEIPVVVWIDDADGNERRANGLVAAQGFGDPIQVRRGWGSGFLPPAAEGGVLNYDPQLYSLRDAKQIAIEALADWTTTNGIIDGTASWPSDSRIHLTKGIEIPAGSSLTIGAGTIVWLDPLVNVTNSGTLIINGTLDQPVVFTAANHVTPEHNTGAWGGFLVRGSSAELRATGAIMAGGGGARSFDFSPSSSHRSEQAVLLVHSGARAYLTNCYVINSAGQVGNGYSSDIIMDHCLLQRAITAGEYSGGGTVLINHSAVIEFPEENGAVNPTIADADYDAIYFTEGQHILLNSLFGFSKDDAIDSGSGGTGTMVVSNCWVESALHECLAWSGGGRTTETYGTVNMNSGQGIECGWSSGNNSPLCYAGHLLSLGNSIGARLGDNYDWTYNGLLRVTNSIIIYNHRDIFGRNWADWSYRNGQMDLHDNFISQSNTNHPNNMLWDPERDGWQLAQWMTTPPDSAVGVGFAVWTNEFSLGRIFEGIPVRLSSFTTNLVSVDYRFEVGGVPSTTGTVSFEPGETVKRIYPRDFDLEGQTQVRLLLTGAANGDLTGQTNVVFQGNGIPAPRVYLTSSGVQQDLARLVEGVPLSLNNPSTEPVSLTYSFESAAGILTNGTITFEPGQTLQWADVPVIPGGDLGLVRLSLGTPMWAQIGGTSNMFFVRQAAAASQPDADLIARGADWLYRDTGTDLGAAWKDLVFDDTGWSSGPAELGYGDGDEATVVSFGPSSSNKYPTTYFRHYFEVIDPAAFTNLSFWIKRDDAAVAYVNGTEVFRSNNLPAFPAAISYGTFATSTAENATDNGSASASLLVAGTNVVAVEIHQERGSSSDISFNFELTGEAAPAPPVPQKIYLAPFPGQWVVAWGDSNLVLQHAETPDGPWSTVATPSPVLVNPDLPKQFFRLWKP